MSPIVKADRRYKPARVHEAWEAEALGQRFIVDTVQAALDALLPEPLHDVRVREDVEREHALRRLKRWR
jgi:hypothetical protein